MSLATTQPEMLTAKPFTSSALLAVWGYPVTSVPALPKKPIAGLSGGLAGGPVTHRRTS